MAGIYRPLGLTGNPFAWVEGKDPGPFLNHRHLEVPRSGEGRLLQLIGVRGAGKSTHLEHWQSITGGSYYYVEPVGKADPPLDGGIVYWDEVDRIGDRQLKKLFRIAVQEHKTVVAGTHRNLCRPATAVGLPITTIAFERLSIDVLDEWSRARIARVAVPGAPAAFNFVPRDVLEQVIDEVGASLRQAGDLLHVWVAKLARESVGAERTQQYKTSRRQ